MSTDLDAQLERHRWHSCLGLGPSPDGCQSLIRLTARSNAARFMVQRSLKRIDGEVSND